MIQIDGAMALIGDGTNTLEIMVMRDGSIDFEIEKPWAGDSESGFGRDLSFCAQKEDAVELLKWLAAKFGLRIVSAGGNP